MLSSWLEPNLFAVVFLGLAVPVLGLFVLATGRVGRRRPWWLFAALAVGALSAAAYAADLPAGFWTPPALLAALCVWLQVIASDRAARLAAVLLGLLRRPAFQAAALVVAGPAVAAAWAAWCFPAPAAYEIPAEVRYGHEPARLDPDPALAAATDAGHPLLIYHPADATPADQLQLVDASVIATRGLTEGVIRTGPPTEDYNCHGWVFTAGRGWVRGSEVEVILKDNAYYPIEDPRPGDLAIYRDGAGAVSHSGVVRAPSFHGGPVLIESKWGGVGRFVSAATTTPYGPPEYYRSARPGHLLHGLPEDDSAGPLVIQEE